MLKITFGFFILGILLGCGERDGHGNKLVTLDGQVRFIEGISSHMTVRALGPAQGILGGLSLPIGMTQTGGPSYDIEQRSTSDTAGIAFIKDGEVQYTISLSSEGRLVVDGGEHFAIDMQISGLNAE